MQRAGRTKEIIGLSTIYSTTLAFNDDADADADDDDHHYDKLESTC